MTRYLDASIAGLLAETQSAFLRMIELEETLIAAADALGDLARGQAPAPADVRDNLHRIAGIRDTMRIVRNDMMAAATRVDQAARQGAEKPADDACPCLSCALRRALKDWRDPNTGKGALPLTMFEAIGETAGMLLAFLADHAATRGADASQSVRAAIGALMQEMQDAARRNGLSGLTLAHVDPYNAATDGRLN